MIYKNNIFWWSRDNKGKTVRYICKGKNKYKCPAAIVVNNDLKEIIYESEKPHNHVPITDAQIKTYLAFQNLKRALKAIQQIV